MGNFDRLRKHIERGKTEDIIPMGFERLNNHVGIYRGTYYLIGGYTGCLSKDTIIDVNRKQTTANTKPFTIELLYKKFHGLVNKGRWNPSLDTKVKVFKPDIQQTSIHKIKDVIYSGKKEVYRVTTESGKQIKTTLDHKFMISDTEESENKAFKKLSDLKVGEYIIVKAGKESRKRGRALKNRKEICGKYPYYWTARKKEVSGKVYQRAYKYRIAYDASINNVNTNTFLDRVRHDKNHSLKLSSPKMVIHHKDENPLNNDPGNLVLLTKKQHDKLHAKTSNYGYSWVKKEKIVSIQYAGIEDTYDIYCDDPYHNFVANDFVVHNSGKTGLVTDAFILNPYDWYLKNKGSANVKLKIIFFSMERSISYMIAKWVSRRIFIDQGEILSVNKMVGRVAKDKKMTSSDDDMVNHYEKYINEMTDSGVMDIIEGPQNPMGIKKYVDNYALSHGHKEKIDEYNSVYIPDNPNEVVIIIYDHIGLLKRETRDKISYSNKKEIIDLASEDARRFRDLYGYSPVMVSQFNRSIANPIRIKAGNVEPSLEDFRDSSCTQDDADVVIALFDPIRYMIAFPDGRDTLGYNLKNLRDEKGIKKYRSLSILKNTYGGDDIGIGLAFQPVVGVFKEMPPVAKMNDDIYEMIKSDSYFLIN